MHTTAKLVDKLWKSDHAQGVLNCIGASSKDDVTWCMTDQGIKFTYIVNRGEFIRSIIVSHGVMKTLQMNHRHSQRSWPTSIQLKQAFPVGTKVSTQFGEGEVTKVTDDRLTIDLQSGGSTTFHRDEVIEDQAVGLL